MSKLNESAQLVTGIHCRVGAAYSIIAPFNREQNATRHDKSIVFGLVRVGGIIKDAL